MELRSDLHLKYLSGIDVCGQHSPVPTYLYGGFGADIDVYGYKTGRYSDIVNNAVSNEIDV